MTQRESKWRTGDPVTSNKLLQESHIFASVVTSRADLEITLSLKFSLMVTEVFFVVVVVCLFVF